jgi:hypothetical protein
MDISLAKRVKNNRCFNFPAPLIALDKSYSLRFPFPLSPLAALSLRFNVAQLSLSVLAQRVTAY